MERDTCRTCGEVFCSHFFTLMASDSELGRQYRERFRRALDDAERSAEHLRDTLSALHDTLAMI